MTLYRAASGVRLPAAFVDLDALDRNVDLIRARLLAGASGRKTLRVASKSVRHTGLLRRILARGGPDFVGLMCFSTEEAVFLCDEGFDDLFVAYPTVQARALDAFAQRAAEGRVLWHVVDCEEHVSALGVAGRRAGIELAAVIELDVSYRPAGGRVHLGARRSPVRSAAGAVSLARLAAQTAGVRVAGLMGYEAHVAGVQDANPFAPMMNPVKRALKRVAQPAVALLRAEAVEALRADGHDVVLVNGGGTGSVPLTAAEPVVTEVTAGSGFLAPHLFDYFAGLELEAAAYFALEVCRVSDAGYVTCAGGGYVASGEPGADKLPLPWVPLGLRYVAMEGAGEVQTPLIVMPGATQPRIGDPIFFRHAKAGELAERFSEYHLVRGGEIEATEPTYRGQGRCFL
ncbi:MAG: alanine racemase [Myxococcales bacterium]|nr:alanine racemase [Myxococcales bacterium]MCB9520271.1 alanine racemase [Myxococcales bacterium]MCB9531361.1 alanine racemase [Myxococcales bacterium]MCB9533566.1 alanine racemase [Myxococcales bacterium]